MASSPSAAYVPSQRTEEQALPSNVIMSWQNHTIPVIVSVSLMSACWAIGYYNLSILWIVLFTILYILKTYMFIQRENKRMRMRQVILQERETIMAQFAKLDELPAWVQFPDTERIEWVNKVVQHLWPYIAEYSKTFLREFIEPQVKAQMPAPFKSFKFIHIDMGDLPCRVGGLKVYTQNVGRDRILVDMDVTYAGDAEFVVQTCGFTGGLNQLVLSGKVRCVMMPLLPYPPMIGGISGSFIELPKFDFNLTGMGEFVQLPGLIDAIRTVVNSQLAALCVLPNKIVIPLAPNVDVTKLYFPEPDGVVRIRVIEARNLENKDLSFMRGNKSDPYCELQVGAQIFKTRTINDNLNPVFNEFFEAVVDQASGQKLRIELFDKDTAGADEELGRLSVPLEVVRKNGSIHRWFHLEGCKHGEINLKVSWYNLSTDKNLLNQNQWESEWITSNRPIHPAILMIFVDNVSDLPYPKANLEPSPRIDVALGENVQSTPVKVKTVNPLYQTKFTFFVRQPEGQELKIMAVDDGTKRPLGDLSIPLLSLMNQPKMEMFQQTFVLTHGVHTSPIVLTVRLRTLQHVHGDSTDFFAKAVEYGNASHIERANRENGRQNTNGNLNSPTKTDLNSPTKTEGSETILTPDKPINNINYSTISHSSHSIADSSVSRSPSKFIDKFRKPRFAKTRHSGTDRGQLCFSLKYNDEKFKLVVGITAARNLVPIEAGGNIQSYVKVKLIPVGSTAPRSEYKTSIVENTTSPSYDNEFEIDIHYSDLRNYRLLFCVKDAINYGFLSKPPTLGSVDLPLANFDHTKPTVNQWVNL